MNILEVTTRRFFGLIRYGKAHKVVSTIVIVFLLGSGLYVYLIHFVLFLDIFLRTICALFFPNAHYSAWFTKQSFKERWHRDFPGFIPPSL